MSQKFRKNYVIKMSHMKVQKLCTETLLTEKCKASRSGRNQRLKNEGVKWWLACQAQPPAKRHVKWVELWKGKLCKGSVTAQCTSLSTHNKHSTVSKAVVGHFAMCMLNACSGYVFNAVSLRQFIFSSCLLARLKHGLSTMQRWSLTDNLMMPGQFGNWNRDFFFSMNMTSLRSHIPF